MIFALIASIFFHIGAGVAIDQYRKEHDKKPQPVKLRIGGGNSDKEGAGKDGKDKGEEDGVYILDKGKWKNCKQWYGGVGFQHDGIRVTRVAIGYPAFKAGLMKDDLVFDIATLRGPPGTTVLLRWMRAGKVYRVEVIREKICEDA